MEYLAQQNRRCHGDAANVIEPITAAGKHVVIIGGGDTGADCLGTVHRQGALSVSQLELMPTPPSLRAKDNPWPLWPNIFRTSSAHEEGGDRVYAVATTELSGDANGHVRTLHGHQVSRVVTNGRASFEPLPNSGFEMKADLVLLGWLRDRRLRAVVGKPSPRSEAVEVARVELAELTPEPDAYLGQLAYLTLVLFENLGRGAIAAPTVTTKSRLGRVATEVLAIHDGALRELTARHTDPVAAMEPFRAGLDDFQRRTSGQDWHEILVTCYLTSGFLLDFFDGLAAGLPGGLADRIAALLDAAEGEALLLDELRTAIDAHPRLASRLALWGRRLVGDSMLVARLALAIGGHLPGEERIEPVFTELIAAHTRRMDALGLTA